ncbi:MAG: HDOD domain-containing protein [Candidatus Pacebacteria bacterium]|jgi:hypothetical protein|nr:HDOD domain-containing protein [Candidatus Paceibacterota bacterium]
MGAEQGEKPVYVTPGFLKNFLGILSDPDASFIEVGRMLVTQPYLVAHLLRVANMRCEDCGSLAKPKSVNGILIKLGIYNIVEACKIAEDVPPADYASFRSKTIDTYSLAVVLSELAERRLGRFAAPDFFLVGLLSVVVPQSDIFLDFCHEEIFEHFKGTPQLGHPTIPEALTLVGDFRRNVSTEHAEVMAKWKAARERAREAIDNLTKF